MSYQRLKSKSVFEESVMDYGSPFAHVFRGEGGDVYFLRNCSCHSVPGHVLSQRVLMLTLHVVLTPQPSKVIVHVVAPLPLVIFSIRIKSQLSFIRCRVAMLIWSVCYVCDKLHLFKIFWCNQTLLRMIYYFISLCAYTLGLYSLKRTDVLPKDLAKSRSREIRF